MRLVRGSHCFVWGSLAGLLYAGPANPQRDIEAALARLDVRTAYADSDARVAAPDLTAAPAALGNKAASDSSYHGGSRRGGYGHGLAADVVSVKGETRSERCVSSEALWKWIDAHGKDFGIGRPYLDRDPPHIAPIDGREYAYKRGVNAKRALGSPKFPEMKASEVRANSVGIAIGANLNGAVP